MSDARLLWLNEVSQKFAGFNREESPFVILGLPMDITSSYRPGSRFAPQAIRSSAQTLEFYSVRNGIDAGEFGFSDVGDVVLHPSDVEENLRRISDVVSYFREKGKITIGVGGEHTVTPGIIEGFRRVTKAPPCVLSIDAHMDLRDEYMGYKYDHACAMRRVHELGAKVVLVGVRAFTKEELDFARRNDIPFVTSLQAESMGTNWLISYVSRALEECKEVYVTYDMDGFDPAYAPGVATPEPEGLRPTTVLDLINGIADERLSGFDVVEVSPPFDYGGITAILAGRLILETSTVIYKNRFLK